MDILSIFLIGVGLSIDAVAVSISNSLSIHGMNRQEMIKQSLCFGGFQAFAPFLGYLLGAGMKQYIERIDHWIAFVLLGFIGLNMVLQSRKPPEEQKAITKLTTPTLLLQGISTSIDALAVGVSFAMMEVSIVFASLLIGFVTILFCFMGSLLGKRIGERLQQKATLFGGLILIAIGTRILIVDLFF